MGKCLDLTGQKFGKLTVDELGEYYISPKGAKSKQWKCRCECGNFTLATTIQLRNGYKLSCGCYKRERAATSHQTHGMYGKRLYNIHSSMMQRCTNPKYKSYSNYGGRGIKVCEEWFSFECFQDWAMANGYTDELTIDRIDVDGNYEPSNCRWATSKAQNNNRSNNRLLTFNGETHTMSEWADITGIKYQVLACRILNHKWPVERALTQEVRKR